MDLDPTDLSTFISHHIHIPTDMLKAHKNESCRDCIPAWLCLFKKGAIQRFEEGFLLPENTSFCKEQEEVCQKKKKSHF